MINNALRIIRNHKNVAIVCLGTVLCIVVFTLAGCARSQPGETATEGHRRHLRKLRLDSQGMAQDIDRVFLTDQPSRLTDKRIP